jgi:hypothetical protein
VPETWEAAIASCLEKEADRRPGSAGELLVRLNDDAGRSAARRNPLRRRISQRGVATAVALAVLAASAGWVWTHRAARGDGPIEIAPAVGWPSDATRAWAAWNLDGNGVESSGRGIDLAGGPILPGPDRFGRIDRAAVFDGASTLESEEFELRAFENGGALSFAIWVRARGTLAEAQTIVALRGAKTGELDLILLIEPGGRIRMMYGRRHVPPYVEPVAREAAKAENWSHVVAVIRETSIELWLNGRLEQRRPVPRDAQPIPTTRAKMRLGTTDIYGRNSFVGVMDDVRLWRRAVTEDEIRALAERAAPPRFALSTGRFSERDDVERKLADEFGAEARLGDWNELIRVHRHDLPAWCEEVGFPTLDMNVLVQRGGERWAEAPRHYMMTRFAGTKPAYYEAHDEAGGMHVVLGSWHGLTARALVRLPAAVPRPETLSTQSGGGVVRALREGEATVACGVSWRQTLARGGSAAQVRLGLRGGGQLIGRCSPEGAERVALILGDPERPQLARQIAGPLGDYEFTVVALDGRLRMRAIATATRVILFQEEVKVPGFRVGDLSEMRLSGAERAEWVVE